MLWCLPTLLYLKLAQCNLCAIQGALNASKWMSPFIFMHKFLSPMLPASGLHRWARASPQGCVSLVHPQAPESRRSCPLLGWSDHFFPYTISLLSAQNPPWGSTGETATCISATPGETFLELAHSVGLEGLSSQRCVWQLVESSLHQRIHYFLQLTEHKRSWALGNDTYKKKTQALVIAQKHSVTTYNHKIISLNKLALLFHSLHSLRSND